MLHTVMDTDDPPDSVSFQAPCLLSLRLHSPLFWYIHPSSVPDQPQLSLSSVGSVLIHHFTHPATEPDSEDIHEGGDRDNDMRRMSDSYPRTTNIALAMFSLLAPRTYLHSSSRWTKNGESSLCSHSCRLAGTLKLA